jgi:hypothetical protein
VRAPDVSARAGIDVVNADIRRNAKIASRIPRCIPSPPKAIGNRGYNGPKSLRD